MHVPLVHQPCSRALRGEVAVDVARPLEYTRTTTSCRSAYTENPSGSSQAAGDKEAGAKKANAREAGDTENTASMPRRALSDGPLEIRNSQRVR